MIDVQIASNGKLIRLDKVHLLNWLPKEFDKCTVYRWATRGIRGIKLETVTIAGVLHTTSQALRRFVKDTAPARASKRPPMIEVQIACNENLIRLADVPRLDWLPNKATATTVYGWESHGIRGIKLETVKIAGKLHTTEEAIRRFFRAVASPPPPRLRPKPLERETMPAPREPRFSAPKMGLIR